MVSWVFLDAKS
uniref:Uncharacterized protein n=1 Tax=Rhizophora mucronata TaxID=61149 RepID=A0A2P2MY49_RHIMU